MTEPETHATPPGPPHDTATETHSEPGHGNDPGHDDHPHGTESLGPIDTWSWGAGALGLAIAAIMVFCFALATSGVPAG